MSWCRWSTEVETGKTSDLYVYYDIYGGVTVLVAGKRKVVLVDISNVPPQAKFPDEVESEDEWTHDYLKADEKYREFFKTENEGITYKWERLPVEYAGKSYNFSDKDSLVEFLIAAKNAGLVYPEEVLERALDDESWIEDEE